MIWQFKRLAEQLAFGDYRLVYKLVYKLRL